MRKEQHEQEIQDFHHEVCLMRTHLRQNDAKRSARGAAASCGGAADQGNPQRISNCWNTEAVTNCMRPSESYKMHNYSCRSVTPSPYCSFEQLAGTVTDLRSKEALQEAQALD